MQIDLIDIRNNPHFRVSPVTVANEKCYLICLYDPSVVWTEQLLKFRSSLWTADGELISASFPKFFNWDERPDLHPAPSCIENVDTIMEKMDGSTLIVSKYKGELIVRTRGTTDASLLDKNGYEIKILKEMYPAAFEFIEDTSTCTRIFEWVSPNNRIVIPYAKCDIFLIAVINHSDYSLVIQEELDSIAEICGVKRPRRYVFDSLIHMKNEVKNFIGIEGVCCYYDRDQHIRKVKGDEYLIRHRAKEKFQSFKSLVDFFVLENQPQLDIFLQKIEDESDHEVAAQCKEDAECIIDSITLATDWMWNVALFVELVKVDASDQKEAAHFIMSRYENKTFQGLAFVLYQNKGVPLNMILKLMSLAKDDVTSRQARA